MRALGSPKLRIAAAVVLAALVFAVAAAAQPSSGIVHPEHQPGESQLEFGSQLYSANCLSCHGIGGTGINLPTQGQGAGEISGSGPSLQGVGELAPDFYLRTGRMPIGHAGEAPERGRPDFNEREIRALVAYVAGFREGPADSPSAAPGGEPLEGNADVHRALAPAATRSSAKAVT